MYGKQYVVLGSLLCIFLFSFSFAQKLETDLGNTLNDYYLHVKDKGSFETLNSSLMHGDIYDSAYAQVELHTTHSSLEAIDTIYENIADKCDGDLSKKDVSVVFAEIEEGQMFRSFLQMRDSFEESDANFGEHCLRVLSCELHDTLEKENKKLGGYGFEVRSACIGLIAMKYEEIHNVSKSIETLMDINSSDDMFLNADMTDSPYDLLSDVRAIADVLFVHNDSPSETHFYNMKELEDFVSNDPDQVTPYKTEKPHRTGDKNLFRLLPSSGVSPDFPESVVYEDATTEQKPFIPQSFQPASIPSYHPLSPVSAPLGGGEDTLQNPLCFENQEDEQPVKDVLDLAEKEQKQTKIYNDKLNLQDNISVLLGGEGDEQWQSQFGEKNVPKEKPLLTPREVLEEIFGKSGLQGELLKEVQDKLVGCVQKLTNQKNVDFQAARKVIWKTLTQPTALTQCVLDTLCREVGDPSGRGMYSIKGCTLPPRVYGISSDQPVESIEGIIDEVTNVCTNLQYTDTNEYNKTKDARDHQMMRIDFSEKFSFTLNVGFKPVFKQMDPAHIKRMRRENNTYLERALLGISDDLTFKKERNRYIRLYKPYDKGINSGKQARARQDVEEAAFDDSENVSKRTKRSQKLFYAEFLDVYSDFVAQNIDMWNSIAGYVDAMNDTRVKEAK